ncbi:MAG: chemotaxis protein CheW [Wolinella sp.]
MMINIDQTTSLHLNNEVQFFCFELEPEGQIYATNVFKVREIIQYSESLSQTEGSNNGVMMGFMSVRGETIPLLDLRRWIFAAYDSPWSDLREFSTPGEKIIVAVCDFSDFVVGVRIYGAKKIISRKWDEVTQATEQGIAHGKVTATVRYEDGRIVQVVDIERMLVDVFPHLESQKEDELKNIKSIKTDKMVLLAEDSPSAMKMMQKILDQLGVVHHDFGNGKLLLDYLFSSPSVIEEVGVVITDLEMPEVSGFEVIKRMKADALAREIPIIVNSSMSGDSNKNMATKLNADGFVSKSNPREIEQALREYLS